MNKNILFIAFALLLIASQSCFAKSELYQAAQPSGNTVKHTNNENQSLDESSAVSNIEDFNFNDNSFSITDEQFEEAKKMNEGVEEKQGFNARVINSGYFSAGTPSKTYTPLNKGK